MKCASCSREIAEGSRFCGWCGSGVADQTTPPTRPFLADAASAGSAGATPGRELSSSDFAKGGRFLPGTMLGRRYRIVGLLGSGGMGDVYRADDLKLGQPVALKFLPRPLAEDPLRLEYFYNEVRLARRVSHPNVCRVYDVGEVHGQHFISMEYVDGEDLASLIRRIGRLPSDKGIDIARQLCAGLAAAHDKGVLHRDLKPANVMLDARGHVRISDFGLASLADDKERAAVRAGTPAYMAPEQLGGGEASKRSDLYSLGLLLFEVFTGKPAQRTPPPAQPDRLHKGSTTPAPSSIMPGIDAAVERVILNCLEEDSSLRPASALAVAAALPGGDPLAAALAAGETPSPEMVAAAGPAGGLPPRVAAACLGVVLLGLAAVAFLSDKTTVLGQVHHGMKKPHALEDAAREAIRQLGYEAPERGDSACGFEYDRDYLEQLASDRRDGDGPRSDRPAAVYFWYRESPRDLCPIRRFASVVTPDDPPPLEPGMVSVRLGPQKRLLDFRAVAREEDTSVEELSPPDWSKLFELADLELDELTATNPARLPPVYADHRAAWEGVCAGDGERIRVEAASYGGRPVFFAITRPDWTAPKPLPLSFRHAPGQSLSSQGAQTMFDVLCLVLLVGAAVLARRNLRLGRSDRNGALTVALFVFSCRMLVWLFGASHVADLGRELALFFPALTSDIYLAVYFMLVYLALEPYVRKLWPETLISWKRLLVGRFRDPCVGRDILIGTAVGISWVVLICLPPIIAPWVGSSQSPSTAVVPGTLLGGRHLAAQFVHEQQYCVIATLYCLLAMLLLRCTLRNCWLARGAFVLIFVAMFSHGSDSLVGLVAAGVFWASFLYLMTQYGLLTLIAAFVSHRLLMVLPITADVGAWYWANSLFVLAALAALGVYGFYTSLGGRRLLGDALEPS